MRIWIMTLITLGVVHAAPISAPLLEVQNGRAAIEAENLQEGMSGFVVRRFDTDHSAIIANARVEAVNPKSGRAILRLSEYDGLRQNALPRGNWKPQVTDTALIAYDYERAMLIAPNDDAYYALTKSINGVEWVHPDQFAAYLSDRGHPTPLVSDFHDYCTANSIGLLYVQSAQTLFTLDCKNFALLQSVPSLTAQAAQAVPFYSRVATIRAAWWGEGSSRLDAYEPYYLEQIALNNPKNRSLYELFKANFSDKSALLRHFDVKE